MHADLGYDPHHLLSVSVALHEGDHHQWSDRVTYFEQIRTTMDTDPEVLSSAILEGGLPPSAGQTTPVAVPGSNSAGEKCSANASVRNIGARSGSRCCMAATGAQRR